MRQFIYLISIILPGICTPSIHADQVLFEFDATENFYLTDDKMLNDSGQSPGKGVPLSTPGGLEWQPGYDVNVFNGEPISPDPGTYEGPSFLGAFAIDPAGETLNQARIRRVDGRERVEIVYQPRMNVSGMLGFLFVAEIPPTSLQDISAVDMVLSVSEKQIPDRFARICAEIDGKWFVACDSPEWLHAYLRTEARDLTSLSWTTYNPTEQIFPPEDAAAESLPADAIIDKIGVLFGGKWEDNEVSVETSLSIHLHRFTVRQ